MMKRIVKMWTKQLALGSLWRHHTESLTSPDGNSDPSREEVLPSASAGSDALPAASAKTANFQTFQQSRPADAIKVLFAKGEDETTQGKALQPYQVYAQALIDELGIITFDEDIADAIDDFTREVVMSAGWYQYRYLRASKEADKFGRDQI